ncbi:uncharacterized protein DS421_19g653730 [Arachis hypogaea]|uniref:Uncharacterized protein n=1 Tax=Arachis hypogaea TaxID=3818 RepID=A0A6B9V893_ARAHY|nr:uncharacterized protein DS421_19g653730 [Arachis hypogaea]
MKARAEARRAPNLNLAQPTREDPSLDFGSAPNTIGSRAAYHLLYPALPSWLSNCAAANRGSITGDEVEHLIGSV